MGVLDDIRKELPIVMGAPISVAILCIIAAGIVFSFVKFLDSSSLSAKDATIETLKTEVEDYRSKLSGATPDEAKAKISALESRISLLEPRSLSDDESSAIRKMLAGFQGPDHQAIVSTDMSCTDCRGFAEQIAQILVDLHWQISTPMVMGPSNPSPTGLRVGTPDVAHPLPDAEALARAFAAAKIPSVIGSVKAFADDDISHQNPLPEILVTQRAGRTR